MMASEDARHKTPGVENPNITWPRLSSSPPPTAMLSKPAPTLSRSTSLIPIFFPTSSYNEFWGGEAHFPKPFLILAYFLSLGIYFMPEVTEVGEDKAERSFTFRADQARQFPYLLLKCPSVLFAYNARTLKILIYEGDNKMDQNETRKTLALQQLLIITVKALNSPNPLSSSSSIWVLVLLLRRFPVRLAVY